jgi:Spy/CpxP family protein refolding chaperone
MKLTFITVPLLGLVALGSWALANDPTPDGGNDFRGSRGGHRASLERITDQLSLTPDQKTKIQPIIDQARPQIETIRREAMERTRKVMADTLAQIRPMLTPEQQKKLDDAKNDRRGGREGRGGRKGNQGADDQDGF